MANDVLINLALKGAKQAEQSLQGVSKSMSALGENAKKIGDKLSGVGRSLSLGVTAPLVAFGGAAVKLSADMEQTRIAFTGLLGSAEAAGNFLKELAQFAAATPFELVGLQKSAQQLIAYGFQAEQVIPVLTAVGDAVAGLGGGEFEIQRVTRALGQMQARGKVAGGEMLQLTEVGIPAWDLLAKSIGVTVPEAMDRVSKGGIDAATGMAAILDGLQNKFSGQMANQSKTLSGIWSNFIDQSTLILIEFGDKLVQTLDLKTKLQGLITTLNNVFNWFVSLDASTQEWIITIGVMAAALGPTLIVIGKMAVGFSAVITGIQGVAAAAKAMSALFLATGPWGLAIAAAVLAIGGIILAYKNWDKITEATSKVIKIFAKTVSDIWKNISDSTKKLYEEIKRWLVDKFKTTIINPVKELVEDVEGFFKDLYESVVGHSIIPDMVREIGQWMGPGLDQAMLVPVQQSTTAVKTNFQEMFSTTGGAAMEWSEGMNDVFHKLQNTADGAWRHIREGFGDAFAGMIVYGRDFKETMDSVWDSLLASFIAILAEMALEWLAFTTMTAMGFNIGGGSGGSLAGSAGNAWLGSMMAGGSIGSIAVPAFMLYAFAEYGDDAIEAAVDAWNWLSDTATDNWQNLSDTATDFFGSIGDAANDLGDSIADVFGWANGGSRIVTRPTLFMAGEHGPEKLTVDPMGGRFSESGGSGMVNVFYGPVMFDEITARKFARQQSRIMGMEATRYV